MGFLSPAKRQKHSAAPVVRARVALPPQARAVAGLILFQLACEVFFLFDVAQDWMRGDDPLLMLPELAVTLAMAAAIAFEGLVLRRLVRDAQRMGQSLAVAAGALAQTIAAHFDAWALTPAERDVASLTIKGFSIAEIAGLRACAEGTVKTHLNAIYRKSGLTGRGALVSLLIDDLLEAALVGQGAGGT